MGGFNRCDFIPSFSSLVFWPPFYFASMLYFKTKDFGPTIASSVSQYREAWPEQCWNYINPDWLNQNGWGHINSLAKIKICMRVCVCWSFQTFDKEGFSWVGTGDLAAFPFHRFTESCIFFCCAFHSTGFVLTWLQQTGRRQSDAVRRTMLTGRPGLHLKGGAEDALLRLSERLITLCLYLAVETDKDKREQHLQANTNTLWKQTEHHLRVRDNLISGKRDKDGKEFPLSAVLVINIDLIKMSALCWKRIDCWYASFLDGCPSFATPCWERQTFAEAPLHVLTPWKTHSGAVSPSSPHTSFPLFSFRYLCVLLLPPLRTLVLNYHQGSEETNNVTFLRLPENMGRPKLKSKDFTRCHIVKHERKCVLKSVSRWWINQAWCSAENAEWKPRGGDNKWSLLREDNKHRWGKKLRAGGEPASWFLAPVHACMEGCNYPLTSSCWYPQSGEVSIQLVSRTRSGAIRALTCAFPPATFLRTLWLTVWFYLCPVEVCVCLEVGFRHIGEKKKPNHFSRWLHFPRDFILLAENQIRIVSVSLWG